MKPRITLITLGVDDLERAVAFYRDGMGLKTDGIIGKAFEYGAVAFFELQSGTSRTWTSTSGKWPGTRSGRCRTEALAPARPRQTETALPAPSA